MKELVNEKNVLFITTKNLDYIRNVQELNLLQKNAGSVAVIGAPDSKYIVRLLKVYRQILSKNMKDVEVVFIGFAPQLVLPILRRRFKRKKIIIDFFISLYDTMVCDRKKVREDSLLARILHRIDKKTLEYCDYAITDTKSHRDFFCKEFDVTSEKIHVLYLEADKKIYYPRVVRKKKHFEDKFVVLYFGSILPLQGVDIVIKAIEMLQGNKQIYFVIIGPVKNKWIGETVEYIDWLPQEQLAQYIAMADLCLAGHFSGSIEKAKRTIPGKAYIYDAMNKRMVLGDSPANHELFNENDKRYFVEMGNAPALAKKILDIQGGKNAKE